MAPYGYKDKDWVGFHNSKSLLYKIDNVVKKNFLRGVMFWAIDLDDFSGLHCDQGKYPLMKAVKEYLTSGVQPPNVSSPPPPLTTKAPPPFTTESPPPPGVTTQEPPLPSVTTQPPPPPMTTPPGGGGGKSKATGPWAGNAGMDTWCESNCAVNNCPGTHCKCN